MKLIFSGEGARMNGRRIVLGGLDGNVEELTQIKNLLVTACGTSKHAGEFGAKLMRDLDCFDSVFTMDSAEVIIRHNI
jgi:glucosamine--fructose-6-phosphate aminotransferase (isomerizing)